MRASRRAQLQVQNLEGRTLLSGASLQPPAVAGHVERAVPGPHITLNGRTTDLVVVNHQGIATVTGSGHLSGIGPVTVSGTVNTKAENSLLATPSLLYADLVITAPKGQVNVHVMPGTIGLNPFAQPVHMQYSVQGGTGVFRRAEGKGLVDLSLYQGIPTNLSQLRQMGVQIDTVGVRFSLHFHPGKLNQWGNFSGMWFGIVKSLVHKSGTKANHLPAIKGQN